MKMIGYNAEDTVTGFKGRAVGFCCYLTGCNQYLLTPRADKAGKLEEGRWFDEQRLKFDTKQKPLVIDNSAGNGADLPAPGY